MDLGDLGSNGQNDHSFEEIPVDFNSFITMSLEPKSDQFDIQLVGKVADEARVQNQEDHIIQKEVAIRAGIDFETSKAGQGGLKIFLHDTTHPLKKCDVNGECSMPDDDIVVHAMEDQAKSNNKQEKIRTISYDYE